MSDWAYTAAIWAFGILAAAATGLVGYAALYAGNGVAVVAACGPALLTGSIAVIAWVSRRELRAEQFAAELAAANERENNIR